VETKWAFDHLYDPISPLENSQLHIYSTSFTMAIVELFLDPHSGTVEMNEKDVAPKMLIYLYVGIVTTGLRFSQVKSEMTINFIWMYVNNHEKLYYSLTRRSVINFQADFSRE
jgi:hypothetical protein